MGGTCSTYRRDEKLYKISVGKPEEKNYSEDLDVDGRIILE